MTTHCSLSHTNWQFKVFQFISHDVSGLQEEVGEPGENPSKHRTSWQNKTRRTMNLWHVPWDRVCTFRMSSFKGPHLHSNKSRSCYICHWPAIKGIFTAFWRGWQRSKALGIFITATYLVKVFCAFMLNAVKTKVFHWKVNIVRHFDIWRSR